MKIAKEQLLKIIREVLLSETISGPYDKGSSWSIRRPKRTIELPDMEKHRQEMKVVGFLERALDTLELIGDNREETRGALKKARDLIYNETGLNMEEPQE